MRSKAVSVLNPNNGRRKNLRKDYEAETDYVSIFKNMNGLIFPPHFITFYGWGFFVQFQHLFFVCVVMILTSESSIISAK